MIELPVLAQRLVERFPDIGRFDLTPHAREYTAASPIALTLHIIAPLTNARRAQEIGLLVQNDPEWRALGINDVAFSLYGEWEEW